jgi:glycosyltransferase involved in cell wall biosynthesis
VNPRSRVLAMVPYRLGTAGSQRTSIEAWAPLLARHGIEVAFAPFASEALHRSLYREGALSAKAAGMLVAYLRRLALVSDLSGYDAVYVHREAALIGPALLERWVVRRGVPLVYGLDDPLFVPYRSPANGALAALKFPGKVARICAMAAAVVVNGSPLEAFARRHSRNVWVVPNLVDEAVYRPCATLDHRPPRLGWIGSASSDSNLELLAAPLSILAERVAFELRLVGSERRAVGRVACRAMAWSPETEVRDLRGFDIGLLPLDDHPWNPWKFNFKLAQYMALGIPPVCTPKGCAAEIVEHGVTGFLASTPEEWVSLLETLIRDEALRRSIGRAAAAYAHRHFTLSANEEAILGAFASVLGAAPEGPPARSGAQPASSA